MSLSSDYGVTWAYCGLNWGIFLCSGDGAILFCFGSMRYSWDSGTTWETLDRGTSRIGALSGDGQFAIYAANNNLYSWDMSSGGSASSSVSSDLSGINLSIRRSSLAVQGDGRTFTAQPARHSLFYP